MTTSAVILASAILALTYAGDQYLKVAFDCSEGLAPANVPFESGTCSSSAVDPDATNFMNLFENCAQEFLNDQIQLEDWLAATAPDAEICTDGECQKYSDETYRAELRTLAGYIDLKQSQYKFEEVRDYYIKVSGTRTGIIEMNDLGAAFPFGMEITNDFVYELEFNTKGEMTKLTTKFEGDLGRLLLAHGLHALNEVGFARSEGINNKDLRASVNKDKDNYKIIIDQQTAYYFSILVALLLVSMTVCCVSWICSNKMNGGKAVYSHVNMESESEA